MTTTDPAASTTAPNYFELLGIDPDAEWVPAHFEALLEAKRQEWSKQTAHPTRRLTAEQNLARLPDIRQTMADASCRQALASEARAHRSAARLKRAETLTAQVNLLSARGFILEPEVKSLVETFGPEFSEPEIRRMLKVPVTAAPPARQSQEALDPAIAKQIKYLLDLLHRADLYEFLQMPRDSSHQALHARAQREYDTVQQQGRKSAEVSARAEVAGFCLDIFNSDAHRERYDATLDASAYAHLLELVELAGRVTHHVNAQQVQQLLDDASLVGSAREAALQHIRDYAASRGWSIELPVSPTGQAAPTTTPATTPTAASPAGSPSAPRPGRRPTAPTRASGGSSVPRLAVGGTLVAAIGIIAAIWLVAFTSAPSTTAATSAPTTVRVQPPTPTPPPAPLVAPTVASAASAPTAQPPQSTASADNAIDASWQALQPDLDAVWGDWPKTIDLLGSFVATHVGHQGAKDKEYAALVSYASDLQDQGNTDQATARLDAAIALQPERKEAIALRKSITASPEPEIVEAASSPEPSSSAPAPAPTPQPQPTPPPSQPPVPKPAPPTPTSQSQRAVQAPAIPSASSAQVPSGGVVAVRKNDVGGTDLFRVDPVNGQLKRLVGGTAAWNWAPVVSPDGSSLAFATGKPGAADIAVSRADGSGSSVVATSGDLKLGSPAWMPNGQTLGVNGDSGGPWEIFTVGKSGGPLSQLTHTPNIDGTRLATWPRLGGPLAVTGKQAGLFRIFVQGASGDFRVVSPAGVEAYAPSWSPDGSRIAFQAHGGTLSGIVTMAPDGSDVRRIVAPTGGAWARSPAWSSDGKWIAYVSNQDTPNAGEDYGDLYIVPSNGGVSQRLTFDGKTYDWRPTWSS